MAILTGFLQELVLGTLVFLLYINKLGPIIFEKVEVKYCSVLLLKSYPNVSVTICLIFPKKLNLNVKKKELVTFRWRKLKNGYFLKFKLEGKRLLPTKSVKHLGVLLQEHLHWNEQISPVKVKLNCAVGILSN